METKSTNSEELERIKAHVKGCEFPTIGLSPRLLPVYLEWFNQLRELVGLERFKD